MLIVIHGLNVRMIFVLKILPREVLCMVESASVFFLDRRNRMNKRLEILFMTVM